MNGPEEIGGLGRLVGKKRWKKCRENKKLNIKIKENIW